MCHGAFKLHRCALADVAVARYKKTSPDKQRWKFERITTHSSSCMRQLWECYIRDQRYPYSSFLPLQTCVHNVNVESFYCSTYIVTENKQTIMKDYGLSKKSTLKAKRDLTSCLINVSHVIACVQNDTPFSPQGTVQKIMYYNFYFSNVIVLVICNYEPNFMEKNFSGKWLTHF